MSLPRSSTCRPYARSILAACHTDELLGSVALFLIRCSRTEPTKRARPLIEGRSFDDHLWPNPRKGQAMLLLAFCCFEAAETDFYLARSVQSLLLGHLANQAATD